jgi:hypothetical protein
MPIADFRPRRRRPNAAALAGLLFCTYAATGCAARCGDDDPTQVAAFEAAWRGDVAAM